MRGAALSFLLVTACAGAPAGSERRPATADGRVEPARERTPGPPSSYAARLADPRRRVETIAELRRVYEDTITAARGSRGAPEVRALVDRIIAPLTQTYVDHYAELEVGVRVGLIRLLTDLGDDRAAPAVQKALEEFAKKPTDDPRQGDVRWAARAAGELRLASAGDALLAAFLKLRASTRLGSASHRDVSRAMTAVPQASWVSRLTGALDAKLQRPRDGGDQVGIDADRDQLFWQTTAAQVLGELRDTRAVEPLLKLVIDPTKLDVHPTAILALVKLGKPAVPPAVELLKEPRFRAPAAQILGSIGRLEAQPFMIEAARGATARDRAVIARELTRLPPNDASKAAFKAAYDAIPPETTVATSVNALVVLVEGASYFHDPTLIDWLLERAAKSGDDELRSAVVFSILELAGPAQLKKAKTAVDKWGTQPDYDMLRQAGELTKRCGTRASCYVSEMASPENQSEQRRFVAIKAARLAAIFGTRETRDEIIARLDAFTDVSVRVAASQAVDHLSPDGSAAAAAQIRRVIEADESNGNPDLLLANGPLKLVMYRLLARAE